MGNTFSEAFRAFITNASTSGAFLYNLIRNVLILPLFPLNRPRLFQETQGSGITQWENSSRLIGSVQVNWFEDATKSIIYLFCFNSARDRVLTIAAVQPKGPNLRTEVYFYIPVGEDTVMGMRFSTGYNINEIWNLFHPMM